MKVQVILNPPLESPTQIHPHPAYHTLKGMYREDVLMLSDTCIQDMVLCIGILVVHQSSCRPPRIKPHILVAHGK